jgi:5-methylcytosine-specific restriction protein A
VALCPNCHREAHFAPNRAAINRELLKLAMRHTGSKTPRN